VHPKIRLKPIPYEANTSAFTASEVVKGESPNQTDGRTARIADTATIGRSAQPTLLRITVRAARVAG
jgi:hypothetical protein